MKRNPQTPASPTAAWRASFWPALVVALLAGQMLLVLVMVYIAAADRSFAVEPDYYQKGLHWDEIAAQHGHNAQLGWKLSLELGDPGSPSARREVRCTLTDSTGRPLDGASLDLIAFPHAHGSRRISAAFSPDRSPSAGNGLYVARVDLPEGGLWEFRLEVRRGPETFTRVVLLDVPLPGESRP
ncbi:MAG: FixH family protein [Thermoguttaceae bacterium]